ncbi:hypothetical protein FJT64_004638 [Amphibalanus amphitrite]|uniref:Uncharacterized protein n=1 Tax=Amphibalanus amphitrite TaxID=1232801 RepID=A0A6A4VYP1_AMPAM|nr:hypothetical protein FJT64_004638 [Amphibalanus amphitrite]KAF0297999.1 hypothetical protein FJT64_004638 [Amphibalanus amphitrite]
MEMTAVREDLAALRREVSALREVVAALREEMSALRGVVAPLREKVTILSEVVAKDHSDTQKLKGENAALHDAMVRLEQAVIEERTTRQTVVEDLRQDFRRRAAPSGRPQGKITKAFHDVTVQTEPQPPADSDTTVLREALRTVTTFDAPSALGEDQLTALLQSLPRLEELTVRVPSFGTGRWLRLLPTSLRTLYVTGPEVTKPRWPGQYGSGLSVSLQGVAADTISHLATELGSRITLLVTDAQVTTIPSQLRVAIIRVGPNTIILPAGVGDSELTELRSSRETVERLSVSAADLPLLREQLPECLQRLNVRGPEVTEPRWPEQDEDDDLSVSLQGVAADTISHLADLGRTVGRLEIYDCPDHTAGSLEPLTRCRGLQDLSVTAADLPLLRGQLPEGLRCLNVRGPEVTEPRWPGWNLWDDDLSVSLQGVAADTISHLADLGRTVTVLEIYDCPDLTAGRLEPLTRCPKLGRLTLSGGVPDTVSLEPLTRCPGLWVLTLSGGVPDAVLDSLSGCPGLWRLTLGDLQRPAETAFTAAAVTRLVKSCRKLYRLYLHCTADIGRAVLTALKEADLGRNSYGRPRTIDLRVPCRGAVPISWRSQEGQ